MLRTKTTYSFLLFLVEFHQGVAPFEKCYYHMTHTMTDKRDGRDACEGINSSLVSIKSSDQQDFILQEITDTFGVDETVM